MIILLALIFVTVAILFIGAFLLSIGGTLFTVLAADLIVAIFVIWLVVHAFRKKK